MRVEDVLQVSIYLIYTPEYFFLYGVVFVKGVAA